MTEYIVYCQCVVNYLVTENMAPIIVTLCHPLFVNSQTHKWLISLHIVPLSFADLFLYIYHGEFIAKHLSTWAFSPFDNKLSVSQNETKF